jgi:hypothetical protein
MTRFEQSEPVRPVVVLSVRWLPQRVPLFLPCEGQLMTITWCLTHLALSSQCYYAWVLNSGEPACELVEAKEKL